MMKMKVKAEVVEAKLEVSVAKEVEEVEIVVDAEEEDVAKVGEGPTTKRQEPLENMAFEIFESSLVL